MGDGHLRILSANISTLGPQAEGFLRSPEMGRIQTVALAEHHVGANSINKLDKLWRQTGFRGTATTAKKSVNSINGTSGGTCMATRSHVAMAAGSREKSDVSGRSGFGWSGQLVRLKGSTVLLVIVYLTNGLAESGENLENMWELANLIKDRELPFICMGDWNMTPDEMQKTDLLSSIGAVIKTPVGVEYTCTSGNRLLDCALVDRRLASVVQVEPYWAVPWKSHSGGHSLQSAAHSHNENCVHTKKSRKERAWEMTIGTKIGPRDKGRCLRPSGKRALYHLWSAAAEECLLKSCELGCKEACLGRGTVLKTRTVPRIPRVAKDESHA